MCLWTTTPTQRPPLLFAHLDATTNLSRAISNLASILLLTLLASTSRNSSPIRTLWAPSTTMWAQRVKQTLQRYKDLQDIIAIPGIDELSDDDRQTVSARAPLHSEIPVKPNAMVKSTHLFESM